MPGERRTRRWTRSRRLLVTGLGVALTWGALGALGYIGGWQLHTDRNGSRLVAAERSAERSAERGARAATPKRGCTEQPTTGQLAGMLRIPALRLTAPVEEGAGDAELSVAVGHAPTSVWPGQSGTAVLLAHDVSYFVHLGQLRPGDRLVYSTPCGVASFAVQRQQVVPQGTAIPESSGPTLVLDTCYPPNALFFTTQRLLVWATPAGAPARTSGSDAPGSPSAPGWRQPAGTSYVVPAPPALVAQGLTLARNEAPMGTMTLTGRPALQWVQSPGPMALEAAALEAYFGGLHAAQQDRTDWWSAIAVPSLTLPAALTGATVTGHDAPLDVEIDSSGGAPTQVVLRTTVTLSGGPAPGEYAEVVTAPVHGSTVTLGEWALTPA